MTNRTPIPDLAPGDVARPSAYDLLLETITDEAIAGIDCWAAFRDRARAQCADDDHAELERDLLAIELLSRGRELR